MEGLNCIVRAYSVPRRLGAKPGAVGGLVGSVATVAVNSLGEGVVLSLWNDKIGFGHGDKS